MAAPGWTTAAEVRNDTFAMLRAGVTAGWGVGVVCGTGLNCVGMGPDGATVRFPSLGELSGDFTPGGAWLGVRGLGLALRAGDGRGDPTVLRQRGARPLRAGRPHRGCSRRSTPGPALRPAAGDGPGGPGRRLGGRRPGSWAAVALVDEVVAMVAATLDRLGVGTAPVEVVVGGGVFENADFSRRVLEGVHRHAPSATLRPLDAPPVLGAALLGLDALGPGPQPRRACAGRWTRAEHPPGTGDALAGGRVGPRGPWVGCTMPDRQPARHRLVAAPLAAPAGAG